MHATVNHKPDLIKNMIMTKLREIALKICANFKVDPNSRKCKFLIVSKV